MIGRAPETFNSSTKTLVKPIANLCKTFNKPFNITFNELFEVSFRRPFKTSSETFFANPPSKPPSKPPKQTSNNFHNHFKITFLFVCDSPKHLLFEYLNHRRRVGIHIFQIQINVLNTPPPKDVGKRFSCFLFFYSSVFPFSLFPHVCVLLPRFFLYSSFLFFFLFFIFFLFTLFSQRTSVDRGEEELVMVVPFLSELLLSIGLVCCVERSSGHGQIAPLPLSLVSLFSPFLPLVPSSTLFYPLLPLNYPSLHPFLLFPSTLFFYPFLQPFFSSMFSCCILSVSHVFFFILNLLPFLHFQVL